jgi:hypothetical protein
VYLLKRAVFLITVHVHTAQLDICTCRPYTPGTALVGSYPGIQEFLSGNFFVQQPKPSAAKQPTPHQIQVPTSLTRRPPPMQRLP